MSGRPSCSACSAAVHLTSSSTLLASRLLDQTVCAICWRPLATSCPIMASCGHLFHPSCLEDRGRTFPSTPDRCPMCGHLVDKSALSPLHLLPEERQEAGIRHLQGRLDHT